MSAEVNLRVAKFAKGTSNTQLETDSAATYRGYNPLDGSAFPEEDIAREEDTTQRDDGEHNRPIVSAKSWSVPLVLDVRGSATPAVDTVAAAADQYEISDILDCLLGAAGTNGTGTTATGGTAATAVLGATQQSGFPVGNGVLFPTATDTYAREVVSRAGSSGAGNLTLDRAYAGAVSNGVTALASRSWYLDADVPNPTHLHGDLEGKGERRITVYGGYGDLELRFPPEGKKVTLSTKLEGAHWTEPSTGLSYAAPTAGTRIINVDAEFSFATIGSPTTLAEYDLIEATVTVENRRERRQTMSALNGWAGFVIGERVCRIKGKLRAGALTGEFTTALLSTARGSIGAQAPVYDCGLQVGRSAGAAMYLRFPQLAFESIKRVRGGAVEHVEFTAVATRPTAGSGAVRLHLF